MKPKLSERAKRAIDDKSPLRDIMAFANPEYYKRFGLKEEDLISFAGGWVNHASPESLRQSYIRILSSPEAFHKSGAYTATLGDERCKQALVDYEGYLYNMKGLVPSNVALGASSTQLTANLLTLLTDPEDKVALLDPAYCTLPSQIRNTVGGNVIRFPVLDPVSWRYVAEERADDFARFIATQKPRAVLLISPDNPTSQILSDRFMKKTLDAVESVGGSLVVDFAYKDIIFSDDVPDYYRWVPTENFCSVHSNSKWVRSLGRRLGWVEANNEIVQALEAIQGPSILSPDTLHQQTLTDWIECSIKDGSLSDYVAAMRGLYKEAAQHVTKSIRQFTGFPCLTPQGGIYTVARVDEESKSFNDDLFKETGVFFVPGRGFGDSLREAVRISYGPLVNDLERMTVGFRRVGKFLENKRGNRAQKQS